MLKEEYSKKITMNAISLGILLPIILAFYLYPHQLQGLRLYFVKLIILFVIGYISFDLFSSTKSLEMDNFNTCKFLMYIFSFILVLLGLQILFTSKKY